MTNIEFEIDKNEILTIKIDLKKRFGPSKSGKTTIIATTNGNVSAPEKPEIKIGINVYEKQIKNR